MGVGGSAGGDRPVRAQIVVALGVALTLVAVPLYLMRRPNPTAKSPAAAASSATGVLGVSARPIAGLDAGKPRERIELAAPQRVRCGAGTRGGEEGELCDRLAPLEEALAKAIRDSESCAPKSPGPGSINYVLTVDLRARALHVFPGASGEWRGPQARKACKCVERALKPAWDSIQHRHRHYTIAVMARYLPESALRDPNAPPRFE